MANPKYTHKPNPRRNPRQHKRTAYFTDDELTQFRANLTRDAYTSESAYLRDKALDAKPYTAVDRNLIREQMNELVRLAANIQLAAPGWEQRAALVAAKEVIRSWVKR